jgi:hypothetical protein
MKKENVMPTYLCVRCEQTITDPADECSKPEPTGDENADGMGHLISELVWDKFQESLYPSTP